MIRPGFSCLSQCIYSAEPQTFKSVASSWVTSWKHWHVDSGGCGTDMLTVWTNQKWYGGMWLGTADRIVSLIGHTRYKLNIFWLVHSLGLLSIIVTKGRNITTHVYSLLTFKSLLSDWCCLQSLPCVNLFLLSLHPQKHHVSIVYKPAWLGGNDSYK